MQHRKTTDRASLPCWLRRCRRRRRREAVRRRLRKLCIFGHGLRTACTTESPYGSKGFCLLGKMCPFLNLLGVLNIDKQSQGETDRIAFYPRGSKDHHMLFLSYSFSLLSFSRTHMNNIWAHTEADRQNRCRLFFPFYFPPPRFTQPEEKKIH